MLKCKIWEGMMWAWRMSQKKLEEKEVFCFVSLNRNQIPWCKWFKSHFCHFGYNEEFINQQKHYPATEIQTLSFAYFPFGSFSIFYLSTRGSQSPLSNVVFLSTLSVTLVHFSFTEICFCKVLLCHIQIAASHHTGIWCRKLRDWKMYNILGKVFLLVPFLGSL